MCGSCVLGVLNCSSPLYSSLATSVTLEHQHMSWFIHLLLSPLPKLEKGGSDIAICTCSDIPSFSASTQEERAMVVTFMACLIGVRLLSFFLQITPKLRQDSKCNFTVRNNSLCFHQIENTQKSGLKHYLFKKK